MPSGIGIAADGRQPRVETADAQHRAAAMGEQAVLNLKEDSDTLLCLDLREGSDVGVHHIALATKDIVATHRFYTEAMRFKLAKAVVGPTDGGAGWAKHLFYETGGGGQIAFWDLHDDSIGDGWSAAISTGMGLPAWVNHLAFDAMDVDDLHAKRDHWLSRGINCFEVDHGFCRSVYTTDPNGILVEWCCDVRAYTDEDRAHAATALDDPAPELDVPRVVVRHRAGDVQHAGA